MEKSEKIKIAITIASVAVISVFFVAQYRRRRKQKCFSSSCYLQTDQKPQHSFKRLLADNSYSPFKHANHENSSSLHPYEVEIKKLLENPRPEFDFVKDDVDFKMSDSYVWVETKSKLEELADVLSRMSVFAVDTEQHSVRSCLGFTALIQISTDKEDYLVDTIALHDEMSILRPVFADHRICKVFHGADNDILWLQRDFHIYVVNLFDTAKACEVLSKPQKSLAYLLETYCSVATNKMLQREDWRQRPLSVEMVQYARTDAHYLLHIANCLVAELKHLYDENSSSPNDKFNPILEASRRSNMVCLQLYTKDIEDYPGEAAASSILIRHSNDQGSSLSNSCETQDIVRRLCTWRDLMARVHDESLRFVFSDQAIVALAEKVPSTPTDIYGTIAQADLDSDSFNVNSSLPSPSPVIYSHLDDFYLLINDKSGNSDFTAILQKCLGLNGRCPIYAFNYSLLAKSNLKLSQSNRLGLKQNGFKSSKQTRKASSRQLFVEKFSCKAPVYHNCRIYANDGRLLCYCDQRKLEWYLRRELAKLVDDNPPAIMLMFEPKGRPEDEGNEFYIQSKKNICVGCGAGDHYLRYRIIPSCYRMHFPEHLKSHRSHDIVLLCVDCHEVAHAAAEKYKRKVAAEFGIPLFIHKVADSGKEEVNQSASAMNFEERGVSPLQLRTAAMALLRHGQRMPLDRREELRQTVMRYYGGREISEEDLEKALLVGMSTRERRRLEKKKGPSFNQSITTAVTDKEQENCGSCIAKSAAVGGEVNNADSSCITQSESFDEVDRDLLTLPLSPSDTGADQELGFSTGNNTSRCEVSDVKSDCNGNDDSNDNNCGSRELENGSVGSLQQSSDNSDSQKHNPKLSLLGHGPHGKQVVDYLMQEYGDEGIRQFCQRWRQVFVEAINPGFLPGGWDIKHSGRREFGEFSVYNPAKKTGDAAESNS